MYRFLILILSGLLLSNVAEAQRRVIDALDDSPVSSASVFDALGNVVGITSENGDFSKIPESAYPITIRCIGYENLIVAQPKDTILQMVPAVYELEDVVVSVKRDVMKQTFYAREYFTLCNQNDTVTYFLEYMADRYVPASKKVKFNKNSLRVRNTRCYTLWKVGEVDSVSVGSKTGFPGLLSLMEPNVEPVEAPESFKKGGALYEKQGKSGVALAQRQNAHAFTIVEDPLAGKKDHSAHFWGLKLVGFDIDVKQIHRTHVYKVNDTGVYLPKDLLQASIVMEADGKGKLFRMLLDSKEPVKIHSSVEIYVTDREYLSKEQATEEYKNKKATTPFVIPASVPKLNAATQRLVKRAKEKK
ncbi:MAG: hypothetical protein IKT82_02410 [Bacteroidaceae bacterium]|nr:hypothetical protein [Bacteroidaceae bacterium]